MSNIMKGLVDEQDIEETKKLSAQEKFKRSMARAGYDMDAGAKRLQDLLDKQKKEREEFEKKEKQVKEDETLQFGAEVTPKISPYAGIKDTKFRGAIAEGIEQMFEEPNYSPTDAGYQQGGWRKMNEEEVDEDLRKWFKEKWVRFGPDGKIRGACARGSSSEGKPKCLPQAKAHALGKKGRKYAAAKKRREDPNPERSGPAKNVATKKKSKSESINEGLWDWIKDKLSNKKPIQWSENYYDFIIRNDPTYLQPYLNAVKNDPNYIEWKKNNPNKPQQATSQTNYASSQNRPNQSASFDDFTAPHGSSENEFKMFVNGQKPAAIVPEPNFSTWAKVINSGKYWTKQLFYNGRLHSVIIVQPGNEQSGQQIYELVQNAMKLAEKGDFRAYQNSNYHRRLGKLLGYPKDKVEQFINNYFKDREDLAKIKIDEQGVTEDATVTRIDSKPITDFSSGLKAYKHTDDWSQSGLDTGDDSYWKNKNLKTNTTKGLFAGDPHRTALYATGNAHETRYVEFTQNGQPIVYFDKKDLPAIRSRETYLTVFDAGNFKKLPTGEWFSENPGKPIKQTPIGDPFKYIADQGWIIRVTDDLDKVLNQVQKMHKAGKIDHYGAEGMNESKSGVAEGFFMGNVKDTELKNIDPDNYNKGEGDFVKNQLHTIKRVVTHLENSIGSEEDLPDWVQSEIAKATDKIVNVMDYSISKKEQEIGSDSLMKEQGVAEGYSDMSGLLSASNLNNSYIITAELAEGGKKKFRVKAQNERVAIEKFKKHHSMAKIINVEEEGVKEGSKYPRNPASYHLKKYPVPQDQIAKPVKKEPKKPEQKPDEKLDELKCWPGYSRVKGVPAGAPGSCKKKTNEGYEQCPECGGAMYEVSLMNEKKDACYYKVKSRYKVWPSAYASGALVKCRKKGASNWGNKSKSNEGQIYSTGGGAGQSQRYYTPKDNLGESSSIFSGITQVDEGLKTKLAGAALAAAMGAFGNADAKASPTTDEFSTPIAGWSTKTDKAGNTTDRYQTGSIDMTATRNAKGQPVHSGGTYKVNKTAAVNVDVPYKDGKKGITTTVGTADNLRDLDDIMGVDASAERRKLDPKAFAKFQQNYKVDEGLKSQLAGAALAAAMAAGGAQADNTRRVVPQADGTMSSSFAQQIANASQNLQVVKPLPNNFEQIVYKGMNGVRDKDDGTIVLIGNAPDSVQVIRIQNNKETTDYIDIKQLGNETKQALSLIVNKSETKPLGKPTAGVKVDRQQNTISYNGKEYNIVKIYKDEPQPRISRFDAKVQVSYPDFGIKSLGVVNVTLAGDTAYAYLD